LTANHADLGMLDATDLAVEVWVGVYRRRGAVVLP
jgi:hypothetical protein